MLPTAYKREFLRKLWRESSKAGITLADALNAASDSALSFSPGGLLVIGTSANGQTTSFAPPSGPITPEGLVMLMDELQTAYDAADDGAEDATIYADMLASFVAIKGYTSDFTQLTK